MAVPFGLVKALQALSGRDFKTCKAALTDAGADIDAAAAALGVENTEPGVACTRSPNESGGVTVESRTAGDGATYPRPGDMLRIHYRGTLCSDGTAPMVAARLRFDSSAPADWGPVSGTEGPGSETRAQNGFRYLEWICP